jgi:hypothetical protein
LQGHSRLAHRAANCAVLPRFIGGWRADTVAELLGNVAYIAKTCANRTRREGPLLDALWPALIDQETWDQVQRYRRGGSRKPVSELRSYVFQGLLRYVRCDRRSTAIGRAAGRTATAAATTRPGHAASLSVRMCSSPGPSSCSPFSTPSARPTCATTFGLYGAGVVGGSSFRPLTMQVRRLEAGSVSEIVGFIEPSAFGYPGADLFPRFGLPPAA